MTMYIPQQITKTVYTALTEQQCLVVSKPIVNGQVTADEMVESGIKAPSPIISELRKMGVELLPSQQATLSMPMGINNISRH